MSARGKGSEGPASPFAAPVEDMESNDGTRSLRLRAQSPRDKTLQKVMDKLRHQGILLMSDAKLPSVVSLVAGGPVRGSWWGHPRGDLIYFISQELSEHPKVLETKLLSGKVTFVHRRLWPTLLAVCRGRESWQLQGLSGEAVRLLGIVTEKGRVRLDAVPAIGQKPSREAARELERRLLVRSTEVHTKTGAHSKVLEAWDHWTRRAGIPVERKTPAVGKKELETAVFDLNRRFGADAKLPWQ